MKHDSTQDLFGTGVASLPPLGQGTWEKEHANRSVYLQDKLTRARALA